MRLEDMLKNVSGITNKVIKENCWEGQFNVLEGIQVLQSKINEVITAINDGIIKGDKGDTPNVQVGETTTLDPNSKAIVTQTGDILNPILNFGIPKGDKGDKGDTGKASESIQDNVVGLDTCWSSQKTVGYVDNMFNSLQDVKGVMYNTDKEYLVATGSKNGVVKDLKISGRSLVNYGDALNIYETTSDRLVVKLKNKDILTGNQITFVNFSNKMMNLIIFDSSTNTYKRAVDVKVGVTKVDIPSNEKIDNVVGLYLNGWSLSDKDTIKTKYLILIGDYTQNPPSGYFEGIASVGNGNEIEVLSRKEDGNLFDGNFVNGSLNASNGSITPTSNGRCIEKIMLLPNTEYNVRMIKGEADRRIITFFDNSFNVISFVTANGTLTGFTFTTPSNCRYATIYVGQNINSLPEELILNKKGYDGISYKQDKKPILFKDTDGTWEPVTELRGIGNICDTIENGLLNIKTFKLVLNGSQNIKLLGDSTTNTVGFSISKSSIPNLKQTYFETPISDKLIFKGSSMFNKDEEGLAISTDNTHSLQFKLLKTKCTDINSCNEYLKLNPIEIIFQIESNFQYEVNPLDLQSFENETMILFNYGVVNGTSEFYIDSNLGSITLENMKRISRIEDEIYQVKRYVLSGDYRAIAQSTYPEDFKEVSKHE